MVNSYSYGWGNANDKVNGTPSLFHHDNVNDNDFVNDNDNVNDNVKDIRIDSIGIEHLYEDKTKSDMYYFSNLREETKREIIDDLKRNYRSVKKQKVVIIKQLEILVYVKLRRINIAFIKLVVYVKMAVLKGLYVLHVTQF